MRGSLPGICGIGSLQRRALSSGVAFPERTLYAEALELSDAYHPLDSVYARLRSVSADSRRAREPLVAPRAEVR